MSQFFTSGGQGLEFQLQHQSFQWIFRTDLLWDRLVGSPCSPSDSQEPAPSAIYSRSWCMFMYLAASGALVVVPVIFSCNVKNLVSRPRIEPWAPALGVQSLSHWTTREVPTRHQLKKKTQQYEHVGKKEMKPLSGIDCKRGNRA